MKISARQYAESLIATVSTQSELEMSVSLDNFAKMMLENRDLNRLDEIMRIFSKLWDQTQGELAVEFTGARSLAADLKTDLDKYLKMKTGADKIVLTEKVDAAILGGFVLRYEDQVIDASLKQSLYDLKGEMSK